MSIFAWLIERKAYDKIIEYGTFLRGEFSWTVDPNNAIRYARKIDADNVIDELSLVGAYPAEHGWG